MNTSNVFIYITGMIIGVVILFVMRKKMHEYATKTYQKKDTNLLIVLHALGFFGLLLGGIYYITHYPLSVNLTMEYLSGDNKITKTSLETIGYGMIGISYFLFLFYPLSRLVILSIKKFNKSESLFKTIFFIHILEPIFLVSASICFIATYLLGISGIETSLSVKTNKDYFYTYVFAKKISSNGESHDQATYVEDNENIIKIVK